MTRRVLLQFAAASVKPAPLKPEEDFARRIFIRANELRVATGFETLTWSDPLARCAREQSNRKDELRFPGHDDPERGPVSQRVTAAGILWDRCGENIFSLRGFDDPVHFAIVFWWYSPGHRANMLNPEFTDTGVGVTQGQDETFFVTQVFLHPRSNPPHPVSRR